MPPNGTLFDEISVTQARSISGAREGSLLAAFEDCHNYIYANEGLLKDRIFNEVSKVLLAKLHDERAAEHAFNISPEEHSEVLAGLPSEFNVRLDALFEDVKQEFPSLFSGSDVIGLKPATLAYVVARIGGFDLQSTPGDVKGQAFQEFFYTHQRGARGEYFTPHPIVRLAVGILRPDEDDVVLDPACGSGGFLIEAIRQLNARTTHPTYVQRRIRGIEINPDVARSAVLRMVFEGGLGSEIDTENALDPDAVRRHSADVVLTNPPFGSRGKVDSPTVLAQFDLAHRWRQGSTGWFRTNDIVPTAPEVLFLERSVQFLRDGGQLAIVLPDGILQNASAGYVRQWLRDQGAILGVVSVPSDAFIPYGTGVKTSVLFFEKGGTAKRVFMAAIERIGYDSRGRPQVVKNRDGSPVLVDGAPAIDEDVSTIIAFCRNVLDGSGPTESATRHTVSIEQLTDRLDVAFSGPREAADVSTLQLAGAVPLREVAEIVTSRDTFRRHPDQGIEYFAISDIDLDTLSVVELHSMLGHEAPSRATFRVREGDIVTAVSGASTGTARQVTAIIGGRQDGAICSNGLAVIRNVRRIDPQYLAAYFRSDIFLRQVRRRMTGHAIPAISLSELGEVLVPVPNEADQLRIAEAVGRVRSLREDAVRESRGLAGIVEEVLPH